MAKEERKERRRFKEQERKTWSEADRKKFLATADKLKPLVAHLVTPSPAEETEEEDDFLTALFKS